MQLRVIAMSGAVATITSACGGKLDMDAPHDASPSRETQSDTARPPQPTPLNGTCNTFPVRTRSDDCEYVGACHSACGGGLAYRCDAELAVPVGLRDCRIDTYPGPIFGTVACCEAACTRRAFLDADSAWWEHCPADHPYAFTCVEWLPPPNRECIKGSGSGNVTWCCKH